MTSIRLVGFVAMGIVMFACSSGAGGALPGDGDRDGGPRDERGLANDGSANDADDSDISTHDGGGKKDAGKKSDADTSSGSDAATNDAVASDGGKGDGGKSDGGGPPPTAVGLEGFCEHYIECGGTTYPSVAACVTDAVDYWGVCRRPELDAFGTCMMQVSCSDWNPEAYDPYATPCGSLWGVMVNKSC